MNSSSTFTTSGDSVFGQFFEWNGSAGILGSSNPSTTTPAAATDKTNTLAVRIYGSSPESGAVATVPPPFDYEDNARDSAQSDNHVSSFVAEQQSPFQCTFLTGNPTITSVAGNSTSGVQLKATGTFRTTLFNGQWANNAAINITNRVAWSSSDDSIATVSNFGSNPTDSNGNSLPIPGPYGFVTWHPPLDGSTVQNVTIKAELFSQNTTDLLGGATINRFTNYQVSPPANCKPVLRSVYAVPNNQIYNVSSGSMTVPMTLLANYVDGRIVDVSQTPLNASNQYGTSWKLEEVDTSTNPPTYTAVNSSVSGGFGVLPGSSVNQLYLTSGLRTSQVRVTGSYKDAWVRTAFSANSTSSKLCRRSPPFCPSPAVPARRSSSAEPALLPIVT